MKAFIALRRRGSCIPPCHTPSSLYAVVLICCRPHAPSMIASNQTVLGGVPSTGPFLGRPGRRIAAESDPISLQVCNISSQGRSPGRGFTQVLNEIYQRMVNPYWANNTTGSRSSSPSNVQLFFNQRSDFRFVHW